jgi:hypothetical protein
VIGDTDVEHFGPHVKKDAVPMQSSPRRVLEDMYSVELKRVRRRGREFLACKTGDFITE